MAKTISTTQEQEKAILIGVGNRLVSYEQAQEYLHELAFLAETAGIKTVKTVYQLLDKPNTATYVGSGKLEEIKQMVTDLKAQVVVFDDELTPTHLKNIERKLEIRVLDRTALILFIFSEHAKTAQAKAQVELAKLQYQLPRLTRLWTHLSRERGGIGLKGAGEQEIETDRRVIRDKIAKLKVELKKIAQQNIVRGKSREDSVRVALVGYTNVGKSTIMNILTKANVLAENKLFATLDTTVRKVVLENIPFLLSDTVGFIRKLPHGLVESFKTTLEEAKEADVLLHIIDVSNFHYVEQMKVVQNALIEIGAADKDMIYVFNKTDLLPAEDLLELERYWKFHDRYPSVFISAEKKENLALFREILIAKVKEKAMSK